MQAARKSQNKKHPKYTPNSDINLLLKQKLVSPSQRPLKKIVVERLGQREKNNSTLPAPEPQSPMNHFSQIDKETLYPPRIKVKRVPQDSDVSHSHSKSSLSSQHTVLTCRELPLDLSPTLKPKGKKEFKSIMPLVTPREKIAEVNEEGGLGVPSTLRSSKHEQSPQRRECPKINL
jgi:hypothetical protein